MSIREEARVTANRVNEEKRLEAERNAKAFEAAMKEESDPVYSHILAIVRQAASRGEYFVDIHGLVTDINGLSAGARKFCLDSLIAEGLKVELIWVVYNPFIGEPRPHRHDIEGWEEYNAKVAEASRKFIDNIHISWTD